jgi:hypothetical protein
MYKYGILRRMELNLYPFSAMFHYHPCPSMSIHVQKKNPSASTEGIGRTQGGIFIAEFACIYT